MTNISCSAIADALVTMLSSASVIGQNNVSKLSYQILESSASVAAIVKWRNLNFTKSSFDKFSRSYDFEIRCFVRDQGNPVLTTERVWSVTDKVLNCLDSDHTLLGKVDDVERISGFQNPEQGISVNGATWMPINFSITVTQL